MKRWVTSLVIRQMQIDTTISKYEILLHSSSNGKESACNEGDLGLIPGSGRSPFLPGESHGQRSLAGLQSMGSQAGIILKQKKKHTKNQNILAMMWKNQNPFTLLVGIYKVKPYGK